MPKQTFYNLPPSKRESIFNAAILEFSQVLFSEASINRIIKTADIPRGSFYQYFDDKEDLFSFVISNIFTVIDEIIQARRKDLSESDALTVFMERVYATVELNIRKPQYVQITLLQSKDRTLFVRQFFTLSDAHRQSVIALFTHDKQSGIIRDDVDSSLIIDMVYALSSELFLSVGMDGEAYVKKMESVINIIKEGIRRK